MATATFSLSTLTSSKTISTAHLDRLKAACVVRLQQDGITSPTDQQIINYIMERIRADLITLTRQVEQTVTAPTSIIIT